MRALPQVGCRRTRRPRGRNATGTPCQNCAVCESSASRTGCARLHMTTSVMMLPPGLYPRSRMLQCGEPRKVLVAVSGKPVNVGDQRLEPARHFLVIAESSQCPVRACLSQGWLPGGYARPGREPVVAHPGRHLAPPACRRLDAWTLTTLCTGPSPGLLDPGHPGPPGASRSCLSQQSRCPATPSLSSTISGAHGACPRPPGQYVKTRSIRRAFAGNACCVSGAGARC